MLSTSPSTFPSLLTALNWIHPAQHISRCPPALAAPRSCHPPHCKHPPSAPARLNSLVNVVPGRSAYYLDLYHSAHLLQSPSSPPSPCRPSYCHPAPGPSNLFMYRSCIWNTLSSPANTIQCTDVNRSGTHLTYGVRQCTWKLASFNTGRLDWRLGKWTATLIIWWVVGWTGDF